LILKLKRTPAIYLVGFMGSGKTTVGRQLAQAIEWPFADLDDDIEAARGMSIPEIFDSLGETAFRSIERQALDDRINSVRRGVPLILALGGGAFAQPGVPELLSSNGVSIWLDCPLDIAARRVAAASNRPLARDPEKFARLFQERQAAYARADYRVSSSAEDSSAVEAILKLNFL
jgi:shikimate kinase